MMRLCSWTEFGYKLISNQLITTHYVTINKIIHVYFIHMTYLMSHVTSLNNTCGWSYKLPRYSKPAKNWFVAKPCPFLYCFYFRIIFFDVIRDIIGVTFFFFFFFKWS